MIYIEGNWYIDSDELQYMLLEQTECKDSKGENKTVRKIEGYYSTLYGAVKGYRDMCIRKSVKSGNYRTLKEVLQEIRQLDDRLAGIFDIAVNA